jgi:site-specific recombinase XerC
MKPPATLAALLEGFFTQRLMNQKQASPHTLRSYRDTFRLLLRFAQQCLHKSPSCLAFEEIDAPLVTSFLEDLETSRGSYGPQSQSTFDSNPLVFPLCRL